MGRKFELVSDIVGSGTCQVCTRNTFTGQLSACLSTRFKIMYRYSKQAHTAIKKSGASQREAEARINQAHRDLASERELVRKALEDRDVAEARWAEEVCYRMESSHGRVFYFCGGGCSLLP